MIIIKVYHGIYMVQGTSLNSDVYFRRYYYSTSVNLVLVSKNKRIADIIRKSDRFTYEYEKNMTVIFWSNIKLNENMNAYNSKAPRGALSKNYLKGDSDHQWFRSKEIIYLTIKLNTKPSLSSPRAQRARASLVYSLTVCRSQGRGVQDLWGCANKFLSISHYRWYR